MHSNIDSILGYIYGGILAFGILSVSIFFLIIAIWQGRRPSKRTHCDICAYNLTGNTTGRCPECGTPIMKED